MSFQNLGLVGSYDSGFGDFDVVNNFYSPVLEQSVRYDRVAGYFSSRVFASAARGVAGLVRNNGKMRLITSHAFTPRDTASIQDYFEEENFSNDLINDFVKSYQEFGSLSDSIAKSHISAMCWMLREGYLEIRVVVPNSADLTSVSPEDFDKFHPKFGVFYDSENDCIAFSGSVNETEGAWKRNIENFDVYQSWVAGEDKWITPKIARFEKLWNGDLTSKWRTIDLPTAVKDKIISDFAPTDFPKDIDSDVEDDKYGLRSYQSDALTAWIEANRVGILEMATGTGKTRTAKACIRSTIELGSLLTIVIAPYQHICDQWAKELSELNPLAIGTNWRKKLAEAHSEVSLGRRKNLTLIVVKNTAGSSDFVSAIEEMQGDFENTLLVGDEVHWLGATAFRPALIPGANFRLGLSATPSRYFDEVGTEYLAEYFGGSVYKLTLGDALEISNKDGERILSPYEYHPILVNLSEEELSSYRELSKKIAQLRNMEDQYDVRRQLENFYNLRAAISKSAESKIPAVRELLISLPKPLKQCLIYCADSVQLNEVAIILHELKIDSQQITGEESTISSDKWNGMNEREFLIHNFAKGQLGVLLAIRCLDEGVDIPSASTGIILASSGNVKEFIQRRGRLMRPFKGKEKAVIYDFCVLPENPEDPIKDLGLVQVELRRIEEFADDALNRSEVYDLIESQKDWMGD
jgi:superfamily II DNA or RNA helicase